MSKETHVTREQILHTIQQLRGAPSVPKEASPADQRAAEFWSRRIANMTARSAEMGDWVLPD